MVKHQCPVCDYIHEDESEVPFDQLPEDFLCPACSVEKGWFQEIPA
jgi:rubredoxin